MNKCIDNGEHIFVARYSEISEPDIKGIKELIDKVRETDYYDIFQDNADKFIITKKIYKGDICTKCGLFVQPNIGD